MTTDYAALLNSRDLKQIDGYSYKLSGGQFAVDVAFSSELDIDENRMSVRFPFADGNRRDGVGDLLEVGGINTSRHQLNPIVLFDHGKQVALPVGLAEEPETKRYTVEIDPVARTAFVTAYFYQGKGLHEIEGGKAYDHALFCEQLFHLMAQKYIRAGSIGYQVVAARELSPDYEMGTPKGLHLLSTLMLEASAVVLPANGDTVRKMLSLPSVCGKPLSPYLVKSFAPYVEQSTKVVSGHGKGLYRPTIDESGQESAVSRAVQELESRSHAATNSAQIRQQAGDLFLNRSYASGAFRNWREFADAVVIAWEDKHGKKSIDPTIVAFRSFVKGPTDLKEWLRNNGYADALKWRYGVQNSMEFYSRATGGEYEMEKVDGVEITRKKSMSKNLTSKNIQAKKKAGYDYSRNYPKITRNANGKWEVADGQFEWQGRDKWDTKEDAEWAWDSYEEEQVDAQVRSREPRKSLDNLRRKYRKNAGGFRRRLRKSSPGSSLVFVGTKDMEKLKRAATAKGIKFAHLGGGSSGTEKVKLMGDDSAIDELAMQYGKLMKFAGRSGRKSSSNHNGSSQDMSRNYKKKDLPPEEVGEAVVPEAAMEEEIEEKLGAQALRRLHEHSGILMEEYDKISGLLENDDVSKRVQKKLQDLEGELTEYEEMFSKLYPDYPGLTGAKDMEEEVEEVVDDLDEVEDELEDVEDEAGVEEKDMDTMDDVAVASSGSEEEDEEPTPDEALEGMEENMEGKSLKSIRRKYSKNGSVRTKDFEVVEEGGTWYIRNENNEYATVKGEGDEWPTRQAAEAAFRKWNSEGEKHMKKKNLPNRGRKKSVVGAVLPGVGMLERAGGKSECLCGKDPCECDKEKKNLPNRGQKNPALIAQAIPAIAGALSSGEKGQVQEASGFLGELSEPESVLDEEGRMKSYHYHKTLDGIASVGEVNEELNEGEVEGEIPPAEFEPGVGAKSSRKVKADPGTPAWEEEEMKEPEHQEGKRMGRKMCKEASGFFRQLAGTRDFGNPHREQAKYWHKQLDDMVNAEGEEAPVEDDPGVVMEEEETPQVGEMGEKSARLSTLFNEEARAIENLNKQLQSLLN